MKRCNQCDAELPDDARFCLQCGTPQGGSAGTQAQVEESGVAAQQGGQAAGERGVAIGGDAHGPILPGDNSSVTYVIQEYVQAGGQVQQEANLQRQIVEYLNWARARFGTIELRGIKREGQQVVQMDLKTAYVHLEAEGFSGSTSWRSMRMNEVLDFGRRLVITGGPGSGKTTVLQYVAWTLADAIARDRLDIARDRIGLDLAREKKTQIENLRRKLTQQENEIGQEEIKEELEKVRKTRLPLPIFIPLSAYAQHLRALPGFTDPQETTLATFISRYLIEKQSGLNLPRDFFARLLGRAQAVILLLDGLDEVPTESERVRVREAIEDLVTGRENIRVLVTCRTAACGDRTALGRGFGRVRVRPLTDEQIEELVRRAYMAIYLRDATARQKRAEELLRGIHDLEDGRRRRLGEEAKRLIISPLLVRMLLIVHFSERRLPEHRAELYMRAIDAMLLPAYGADEAVAERIGRLVGGSQEVHRELVQRLAFAMHSQGEVQGREISEDDLRQVLTVDGFSACLVDDFIALTRLRGTLLEEQMGSYRFIHLAFQEYLAARYLCEVRRDVETIFSFFLKDRILDPWWPEPMLLVAGYLSLTSRPTARSFLHRLAGAGPDLEPRPSPDAQLAAAEAAAAACLEWQADDLKLRHGIAGQIATLFRSVSLMNRARPDLRAAAGDGLGELGDPRFRGDAWHLPDERLLGLAKVPGGPFLMGTRIEDIPELRQRFGRERTDYNQEAPQHPVKLTTYYIARYPATVAQWQAFLDESGYEPSDATSLRGLENHPVVWISWYDALEYCRWLTRELRAWDGTPEPLATLLRDQGWILTLPSEAEWEKAARGTDGRRFPWGDTPDPGRANYNATSILTTSAVGCFPGGTSPYGAEEFSGNVWEWTRSLWRINRSQPFFGYPYDPEDGRENLEARRGEFRIVRGGSFYSPAHSIRCARWYGYGPDECAENVGFRVALVPSCSGFDVWDSA